MYKTKLCFNWFVLNQWYQKKEALRAQQQHLLTTTTTNATWFEKQLSKAQRRKENNGDTSTDGRSGMGDLFCFCICGRNSLCADGSSGMGHFFLNFFFKLRRRWNSQLVRQWGARVLEWGKVINAINWVVENLIQIKNPFLVLTFNLNGI